MSEPPPLAAETSSGARRSSMKLVLVVVATSILALVVGFFVMEPSLRRLRTVEVPIPTKLADAPPALTIVVTGPDAYSVEGKTVNLDAVRRMLVPEGAHPVHSILIRTSPGTSLSAAISLLDAVRAAGIQQVSVEPVAGNEPKK